MEVFKLTRSAVVFLRWHRLIEAYFYEEYIYNQVFP